MANPKIQLRHDTSTNWQTQNPVLLEGEVAIETDSNKVKIGNGTDNYNTLPYITDQTKVDLDYSNADYQPVNKAGDTMAGILSITSTDSRIFQNNISLTKGETPSKAYYMGFMFNDKNGDSALNYSETRLGMIEHQSLSDGTERIVIAPYRNVANSTDNAAFSIGISRSGNGYCSFPNTTCCDGQWVTKTLSIETTTYAHGDATKQFSLSNYLPNDNKEYLVLGNWNGNSADAYLEIALISDVITANTQICRIPANTNGGTSFVFPVGAGRYIKRRANNHSSSKSTGNCYLYLMGYRRIGTNA